MTAQTQSLVVGEKGDQRAAQMAAAGSTLGQIAAKFDPPLSIEQARAAVERGRRQVSDRMPKPMPRPPVVVEKKPVPLEPDELLAWAEQDGPARARTVAARIRKDLAELTALHEQHAATDVLRKTIGVLERQLAAAKAELQQMTGKGPKADPAPLAVSGSKEERELIRAWARENGHKVADFGMLGKSVVEAYRAAHAGGAVAA